MNDIQNKYKTTDDLLKFCKACKKKMDMLSWMYCSDEQCLKERRHRKYVKWKRTNKWKIPIWNQRARDRAKLLKQVKKEWPL